MPTQKIYYTPGTPITFQASGGSAVWTPQNEATGKGRISAVYDRGAGSLPARYRWRIQTRWAATPTAGDLLRLYLITSNTSATAAQTDGNLTFGDAELAAETALVNQALHFGTVVSLGIDSNESTSGIVEIWERYIGVAMWNAAASKALTNTAGDHILTITPVPWDVQAAA